MADLMRATLAPLPDTKEDWSAKAARTVAKYRKDHPTAVIVAVTKRRPA